MVVPKNRRTIAYDVYWKGKLVTTVFYNDDGITVAEVKRGLVDHDGYRPGIVVRRRRR